jgi:integral membrane sensor domain MASE1
MRYFPSAPNKIGLESDPLAVESLNLKSEKKIKTSLSTYAFRFILIFASYYITGHLGLKIDAENDFATLIWAPSGIALAALYVWGTDYWPAVFLSATLVNVAQHATIFSDVAIGIGNVAEVILGVYILKKYKQFDTSLSKLSDIIAIIIAAIVTSIPDAFIGTAVCWMESVTAAGGVASTWKAWWLGDTMGIMIVAPLIFVLGNQKKPTVTLLKLLEVGFLILAFISINLFAFTNIFKGFEATLFSQPYILFPCVIWAAFRFGQEGTVTAIFIISVFAMAGTALNIGPFAQETIRGNLYLLDGFIIIIAVTGLSLAAAVTERKTAIADLKAIEGQLKDAIRHRDDFLSIASHELKTPITSLSLQLQITERSIDVKKNILPSPQKLAQTLDFKAGDLTLYSKR